MAQILKPNRSDNRGVFKRKTSTKVMFSYRIEPEHKQSIIKFIHEIHKTTSKKIEG